MPDSYTKKIANIGTGLGLTAGAVFTVLFPPTGIALGLGVLAGASAGAAVGVILGASSGKIVDKVGINLRGRVVQILGPRQVGKNGVYGTIVGDNEIPHPTSLGTNKNYRNSTKHPLNIIDEPDIFQETREVDGEDYLNWEEIIIDTDPHGIIYVVDAFTTTEKTDTERQDKLKIEVEGIGIIENALRKTEKRRIQAFMILLNKIDLTSEDYVKLTEQYRQKLLEQKIENKTVEDILRSVLCNNTMIRVHPFCAEREKGPNFNQINQLAIKTLNKDLHVRAI